MQKKQVIILTVIFVIATILIRLIPHPWNFSPMGALFLFSGFYLSKKWILLPAVALIVTDMIIGTYQWQIMMVVYGSYAIMMFISYILRQTHIANFYKAPMVLGMSIGSAILFFIVTNFAHWMWFGGYAHNAYGLMLAYMAGIPFFRNSLMGYVFYSAVFFGIYELIKAPVLFKQKKTAFR